MPVKIKTRMKQITTLIIDDEISAIHTLRGMLDSFCPHARVLGHASTVGDALEATLRLKPQLIFLDIEMPPFGNAFDFLKQIKEPAFGVIFTTAYPQYAIQAIQAIQPWAYLVKPYSVGDLMEAMSVAGKKLRDNGLHPESPADPHSLVLPDPRKGNVVVRSADILFCRSDKSTVDVWVRREETLEKYVLYRSLKELESDLPESVFCRTHNSYLVNMGRIERFERTGRNGVIHLPGPFQVFISVQRMSEFEQKFQSFLSLPKIS